MTCWVRTTMPSCWKTKTTDPVSAHDEVLPAALCGRFAFCRMDFPGAGVRWRGTHPVPGLQGCVDAGRWRKSGVSESRRRRIEMAAADFPVLETAYAARWHRLPVLFRIERWLSVTHRSPVGSRVQRPSATSKACSTTSERQKKFAQIRAFGLMNRPIPLPSLPAVACSFTPWKTSSKRLNRSACKALVGDRLRTGRNKTA